MLEKNIHLQNISGERREVSKLSYLLISHDIEAIYYLSDSIAVMYLGRIVEYIEDISLFDSLCHPYTKKLLFSVLSPDPRKKKIMLEKHKELDMINLDLKGCAYAPRCKKATEVCFNTIPELKEVNEKHYIACHQVYQKDN